MADLSPVSENAFVSKPPSLVRVWWTWTVVGAQSFGGGAATLYLIRRVAVERHAWITDEEFTRYWGICQLAPGINILGMVILIGWRASGLRGALLALAGLLLPSTAITVALTAVYSGIRDAATVRAALSGVIPATVGLGLLLGYTMVRPLLAAAWREGRGSALVALSVLIGSALAAALTRTFVLPILWGAGVVSALAHWRYAVRQVRPQ